SGGDDLANPGFGRGLLFFGGAFSERLSNSLLLFDAGRPEHIVYRWVGHGDKELHSRSHRRESVAHATLVGRRMVGQYPVWFPVAEAAVRWPGRPGRLPLVLFWPGIDGSAQDLPLRAL